MRSSQAFRMPFTRLPHSSYYEKDSRPGAALYRARQPYLVKNAVTGLCLVGVVAAVYTFTIRAIGQDDFSDVEVPNAPVQPSNAPHASNVKGAAGV